MFENKYLAITIKGIEIDLSRSSKTLGNDEKKTTSILGLVRPADKNTLKLDKAFVSGLSPGAGALVPEGLSIEIMDGVGRQVR